MMSGCANSDAVEGTSLPTKGIASFRRDRGVWGSSFCCFCISLIESSPNDTRSIFCRQWGKKVLSHSSVRLISCIAFVVSSLSLSFKLSSACSRSCAYAAVPLAGDVYCTPRILPAMPLLGAASGASTEDAPLALRARASAP